MVVGSLLLYLQFYCQFGRDIEVVRSIWRSPEVERVNFVVKKWKTVGTRKYSKGISLVKYIEA